MSEMTTLDQALKLADQDCPLPSLAGPALKLLRDRVRDLEGQQAARVDDEMVRIALSAFNASRNYGGNVAGVAMRDALEAALAQNAHSNACRLGCLEGQCKAQEHGCASECVKPKEAQNTQAGQDEAVVEIIGWNQDATPRLRIHTKLHNLPVGTKLYTRPAERAACGDKCRSIEENRDYWYSEAERLRMELYDCRSREAQRAAVPDGWKQALGEYLTQELPEVAPDVDWNDGRYMEELVDGAASAMLAAAPSQPEDAGEVES